MCVEERPLPKNGFFVCVLSDCMLMATWTGPSMLYNYKQYMIFLYQLLCYSDCTLNTRTRRTLIALQ